MNLKWKKIEDELFNGEVWSLFDDNNNELVWLYYDENSDRWVVCFTANTPIKEIRHYRLDKNNEEDVKFRAILELQYEFDKKAKEYFKYCDCISEMSIEYIQGLNNADK